MVYLRSTIEAYNHHLHIGEQFFLYNKDGKRVTTSKDGGELMLKTPKQDIHGKVVWEGDIVGCYYKDDEDIDQVSYLPVMWSDKLGAFALDDSFNKDGSSFAPLMEHDDIEIFGNIYEHKHLLNNVKNDQ